MKAQNLSVDYVEFKNIQTLLINAVSFKLNLINFVYFFETPGRSPLSINFESKLYFKNFVQQL